jgi:hypothetical protein
MQPRDTVGEPPGSQRSGARRSERRSPRGDGPEQTDARALRRHRITLILIFLIPALTFGIPVLLAVLDGR